jgi:ATP-binding protein involved in chromosome partitioning
MRAAAENALKKLPGVSVALVSLTAEKQAPAPPKPLLPRGLAIPGVSHIVAVASGKGGVGKSTCCVNLALGLASLGWRIGILDADVYGPSLPRLLGLKTKPQSQGRSILPLSAYGVKAMSIGFFVDEQDAMIWRGAMVVNAIQQLLRDVSWGELDCLLVDMPPGTGDAQLTLAQNVPLSGAVIVSTPQDLALIDARRGIAMFDKVAVPVLGIIENMSYFLCPHCGGRSEIFAHGGARAEAGKFGVPFLGEVPLDIAIREQSDAGRPLAAVDPDGEHAKIFRAIAAQVKAALEKGRARAAPKIVIE